MFRKSVQQWVGIGVLWGAGMALAQSQNCEQMRKTTLFDETFIQCSIEAKVGVVTAQNELGYLYEQGLGTARDLKTALGWYEKAAVSGDVMAQTNAGRLYLTTFTNAEKAVQWLEKAASKNYVAAELLLARMYHQGLGVTADSEKALNWYEKAVRHTSLEAWIELADIYNYETKNHSKAAELYQKAASHTVQNPEEKLQTHAAQYALGQLYLRGLGVPASLAEAVKLLEQAAAADLVNAKADLAILYITSTEEQFSKPEMGLAMLSEVYDSGIYRQAALGRVLGNFYSTGYKTIARDAQKAITYFTPLAEAGDSALQYLVAALYFEQNKPEQGITWLQRSAFLEEPEAMYSLGMLYLEGKGLEKNPTEAKKWLEKASGAGLVKATEALGKL